MKRHMTLTIDLLTFVLFGPFLIFIFITTGLALVSVLNLDSLLPTQTEASAQPRLHIVKLPPIKPALTEAVATQMTSPVDPAQEQAEVPVAEAVELLATEAQDAAEPAEILAANEAQAQTIAVEPAQAQTIAVEPAQTEIIETDETPQTESSTMPEPQPVMTAEEPVLAQEPAEPSLPEPAAPELTEEIVETPPVTTLSSDVPPMQQPLPVQQPPPVPAGAPDISYFDKLLEQVKQ